MYALRLMLEALGYLVVAAALAALIYLGLRLKGWL